MKITWSLVGRGIAAGFFAFALSIPSRADQTITGNLTVTGTAAVNGAASVGGDMDVEGNNLTLGNNAGNYGVGTFYLPSGSDGARWRLTRVSAWLWEVDNAGTVTPAMRLDASNNLTLYSGGSAGLTLNPAAQSLSLGNATLTASGTALTTNGALAVGGALTAPSVAATSGSLTGGTSGLTLNAGGADQNVVLNPSGNGNVIINGNLGVGTATPGAKVDVAGNVRISSTSDALLGVGASGLADNGSFEVFAAPALSPTYFFPNIYAQTTMRSKSNISDGSKLQVAGLLLSNEVTSTGQRTGLVIDVSTPATYSASAGGIRGIYAASVHAGSGSIGNVVGQVSYAGNASPNGTANVVWGHRAIASNGNGGAASITTNLTASNAVVQNVSSAGLVTSATGVLVSDLYNVGTITNTYGVYVGDITSGTQTNKPFSFYASDPNADNYFAGNVGIGTATPSERLHVSGQIRSETTGVNFATLVGTTADSNVALVLVNNGGATPGQWSMRNDGATGSWVLRRDLGGGVQGERLVVSPTGDVSVTGSLALVAGTASRAPLMLQGGQVLTTPVFGAIEFNGTNLYVTNNASSPTRQALAYAATTLAGYGITDPVVLTTGSYTDPSWITALSASKLTGTLAASAMPAFSGDATSSAGSTTLTLANSGVSAGTYAKVTVDAKGRVTSGATLAASDVTNALGYTPVNKAGDTMTGALSATTLTASSGAVTGGSAGLTLSAGGSNQNIVLAPSGTGSVTTSAPVAVASSTASTASNTGALVVTGGVGVGGSVNVGGSIATGGLTNYPTRIHTLNLSAQPTNQFFPITLTGLPQGKIYHFSVELPSQGASSTFNQHSLAGSARGGGWSDYPSFFDLTNTYYDANERSVLGLYRSTQGWPDVALYVRGGATYYLTTDAPSVAVYTAAQTFGDTTFAIKDSTGADVSGASAAITRMFDSYTTTTGRYTDRSLSTSSTVASTNSTTGALTVAGGVGIAGDLNVGGAFSASNYTASNGTVSGGATGLTLNAGGTNQNVALVPSGTGKVTTNLGDVAALSANGFAARTGSGAYAARAIVGTAGQINVANGDGVAGNPTISLPSTITQPTTFSGLFTVGTASGGTLWVGQNGPSSASELRMAGNSSYDMTWTNTGARTWKFEGTSSAADFTTTFQSVGGGKHNLIATGTLAVQSTTASTSTTTGSATFGGGIGVAGTVSARNVSASSAAGTLPAGTTSGQNSIYVSGSGDAGGTSDFRPTSIQATALGANSMALRTLDVGANAQNTAGNVSMLGIRVLTNLTSTGNGSGTAFSASPYVTSTGNLTWWVGYEADNGSFSSTGDVTGPMTAFRNATFGRAAATTVTAFHAQDLVKGSGIAAGFRGQVSAATGKYNLYLDGTAANLLAGQTSITNTTASTSSTTGALTVAGGVGIAGDLNVGGTFSSTNYTASGGNVTGGNTGLNLNAGGSNQNIVLTPSGTGVVRTNLGDVAALSTNGFAARTGSGAYAARAIVGTAGQVNVTNGDGVAGNPTVSLPSTITQPTTFSGKLTVADTTTATSAATGSATFAGGIGVTGTSWYGDGSTGVGITINKAANADHLRFSVGGSVKSVLFVDNSDRLGVFGSDLRIVNATASTGPTTGALTVAGGVGIAGAGYFGGNVGVTGKLAIGGSVSTDQAFRIVSQDLTGTSSYGIVSAPLFSTATTVSGHAIQAQVRTAASAFTMTSGRGVNVTTPSIGAGSSVTTLTGLYVDNQGTTDVTNAYGIDIAAQTGASATNVGLRNAGTTLLTNATDATSTTTGALQVAGGGSFQKDLYVGGNLVVTGTLTAANSGGGSNNGVITGSTNGLALNAGGTGNQNITLTPTGAGSVVLNGSVGIGTTSSPLGKLDVKLATDQHVGIYSNGGVTTLAGLADSGNLSSLRLEGTPLTFGGASGAEHMRITANGNVGIGTTSPAWSVNGFTTLDVRGSSFAGLVSVSTAAPDADLAQLGQFAFLDRNTTSGVPAVARIVGFLNGTAANNRGSVMVLSTKKDGGPLTDAVRIDNNQNVGIGTAAPTAKLHVNGTARFDGPVRIAKQGDLEMGEFTQEPTTP